MAELTLLLTGAVHGTVETALSPVRKRHIFDYYSDMVGEYVCADEKYTVNLMVDGELCSDFSLYLNNEQNELPASGAIFSECYGLARLRVKLGDVRYETGSFGVLTGAGADGHEVRSMAEYTLRYISACRPPSDGRNASEELLSALCSSYEGLLRSVRMSPYRSGGPVHHPVSVPVTAPGPYRDPLTCPKELSLSVGCLRRLIITLTALRQRMSLEYVRLSFDAGNEAYMDSAWHLGRLIKESLIADTEKVSESVVRLQRVLRGLRPFVGELPGAPFSLPAFTGAFTEKREFRQVYAALRAYEKYDAYASPPFVPEALLNTGRMYEYYCLIRLLHAAEQNGFDTESAETFPYRDRYAADP